MRVAGKLWDITEEKRDETERDLRLGQLGHDLRGPLSAISMGIRMLQRDVPAKAKLLSSMRRAAGRGRANISGSTS